jgi:hypothetical protein
MGSKPGTVSCEELQPTILAGPLIEEFVQVLPTPSHLNRYGACMHLPSFVVRIVNEFRMLLSINTPSGISRVRACLVTSKRREGFALFDRSTDIDHCSPCESFLNDHGSRRYSF